MRRWRSCNILLIMEGLLALPCSRIIEGVFCMKNWKHFAFICILAILVFGYGCSGGNNLNGTWQYPYYFSGGQIWIFSGNKITIIYPDSGQETKGTYLIKDETIEITFDDGYKWTSKFIRVDKNTIMTDEGGELTRQSNADKSSGSTKITEKNLVGVWELENEVTDRIEFFNDGTGIGSSRNVHRSFTWRLRDGNRLQIDITNGNTQISEVELSENGRVLTIWYSEHHEKGIFRKK